MKLGRPFHSLLWRGAPAAAALVCASVLACASVALARGDQTAGKISRKRLEALINRPGTAIRLETFEVEEGRAIEGNVAVIEGDFEMQSGSVVAGDVIVVAGDALLNGKCTVKGDLVVVDGFLYVSDAAEVDGRTLIYKGKYVLDKYDERTGRVTLRRMKDPNRHRLTASVFPGPFNRVDGHNFDFSFDYKRPEGVPGTVFEGTLRIPTEDTHDGFLQFAVKVSSPLLDRRLLLEFEAFKRTATEDRWRASDLENSLVAFFTGNDDRDYYEETGGSVTASHEFSDGLSASVGISSAEYRSLDARSPFTLFQSDGFRANPPVLEGHLSEVAVGVTYDTRFDRHFPSDAWFAEGRMRAGTEFLDGEKTYTVVEAAVRRHQRLSSSDFLDVRFRMAGATDVLPPQRTFSLGSVGGVRGKDFGSWSSGRGDRLLLASLEYRRRLRPVRYVESLFSTLWLVAFYDAGALFESSDPEDLGTLFSEAGDHAGSGAGLGVSGSSFLPYIGLFVAKDLDSDSWRFIVRMNRPF